MISYLGNPKLKESFVKEIEKHRVADQIEQGHYGKENGHWKGCAVACSLRSLAILDGETLEVKYSDHSLYETKLGIPEWLARLEDTIFEGLPTEEAKKWPGLFAQAIPVGKDLDPIKYKFCVFILKENIGRVLALAIADELKEQVVKAIQGVLSLHEKAVDTSEWDESVWSAAEAAQSAAWSAWSAAWSAWSAAQSASRSAQSASRSAQSAAWSASRSAQSAAEAAQSAAEAAQSAAWSAWSAAWSASRSAWSAAAAAAAYQKYADELIRLIKDV